MMDGFRRRLGKGRVCSWWLVDELYEVGDAE